MKTRSVLVTFSLAIGCLGAGVGLGADNAPHTNAAQPRDARGVLASPMTAQAPLTPRSATTASIRPRPVFSHLRTSTLAAPIVVNPVWWIDGGALGLKPLLAANEPARNSARTLSAAAVEARATAPRSSSTHTRLFEMATSALGGLLSGGGQGPNVAPGGLSIAILIAALLLAPPLTLATSIARRPAIPKPPLLHILVPPG